MDTTYRLSQTGKEVQRLLDQVPQNQEAIAQETENREQSVSNETERAQQAEQQLQQNINTERTDRIADVDAEEARAKAAEAQLQQNIDAVSQGGSAAVQTERERAQGVEQTLQQNINNETSNRIADVDAEETRAQGVEQTLQQNINNETSNRIADVDAEETRAKAAEQANSNAISGEITRAEGAEQTLQNNIDAEEARARAAEQANANDIDGIESKIPEAASDQNQLADKQFVNSSIQTATAEFKGTYNLCTDLYLSVITATHEQIGVALKTAIQQADNNDYCFVQIPVSNDTPTVIASVQRYKFNGTNWLFEYALNNSGFTQAQWDAINSGITSGDVSKLSALPTSAQLTSLLNDEEQARIADVDAEESRAKAAEQLNATNIGNEITRAEAAEQTLQGNIDAEETRARGAEGILQNNIDAEETRARGAESTLQNNIDSEETRARAAEQQNAADIDAIEAKIPVAASSSNQLADKAFVNSSIQTNTAEFKGTFNSLAELQQVTANANDYGYVVSTDSAGNTVYSRYKYVEGSGWVFEYNLNNSSFTAAEWAAIQSGITALLVQKLTDLPTYQALMQLIGTKQDALTFDTTPTENSHNPVQSGGIFSSLAGKQDKLTFDQQPTQYSTNPVVSGALFNIFQAINSLFPAAASTQNKLTDKQYVDDKVAGAAPDFVGIYASVEQLEAVTGMTVNDYAFVTSTDTDGNTVLTHYTYNGTAWAADYSISSNNFTQAQWTAINSGITALLVQKLADLPTSTELTQMFAAKQNVLTFDSTPTQGSQNPVTSEGIANAILAAAGVQFVDVQTLPTAGADTMGKVYLTPSAQQGQNASDWWVTIYDTQHDPVYYWKQVNTTSVDLLNYYTKQEVDAKDTRLQTQIGERNVTVEAQDAPSADTLTYTNALGETANHIVGDKRVVPNSDSVTGYDVYELLHLANGVATWGIGGGSTDIRQKLWVNLLSNQQGDTDLNGVTVKVEADDETILDTTWAGETVFCRISPLKQVKVTVGSKTGYYLASNIQTFESSVAGERTINFNYETCVVKFQPTSNQGAGDTTIEGATGTINGVAVNYGDTLKVAMGQSITVHCDAIENYVTPADYTGTAATAQLTPSLIYQTTLVTISWESNLGTDPVIDAVQATVAGRTVSSGETIKVATGSSVDVVFPDVEGYRTPSIATFVAEGTTVVKPTVQYSTDVYTISIDSNQADKTDIENVTVVVNDGVEDKTLHDGDTVKIPTGTIPVATATDISGYRKTISVTAATLTIGVQYDTTLVSVNATSNQSTQQVIDPVLTGLVFGINGTEVSAGQQVKVPTGSVLTITSPDITHYAKTVTAAQTAEGSSYIATVAYTTTLVSVNMVSVIAGIETTAPTGSQATVSYSGGTDQVIQNGTFAKIPTGTAFTVVYDDVSNYGTPSSYSGTATGTSMTATKAEYVQGVVVINISMSDGDSTALALAGATVSIDGGTPVAYTGRPIAVAPLSRVVVHFTDVEGYATPADQSFIMPTGTQTVSATYQTDIYTVYVTSNQPSDTPITSKKVTVSYTGLATPKQIENNGTIKVPTGLTPTATAENVTNYAKTVSVNSNNQTITAAYETTVISVNMVSSIAGTESAAPQGAQATVSYQGGTDQVLTSNAQTAKVPTGTAFTITYAAVNNYSTPIAYSNTATGTSMTATKAEYIQGVVVINISMSDNDSSALALAGATVSIDGGTPIVYDGNPVPVSPQSNVTVHFTDVEGYATPADQTFAMPTGTKNISVSYDTTIFTVFITSNQQNDQTIASKKVSVTYTGLATPKDVANNGTVKVPTGLTPTATAPDETGYAKEVTVLAASRIITAAYQTTLVSVEMVGENAGVEGAAPTGAQATVSYQGGADQVLTDNTQTAKVPTGTAFTITYAAVSGYATPATYSATASGTSMTATKAKYIYGAIQLNVSMSDNDATALVSVAPMISINSGTPAAMTGSAGSFTANLEVGDEYEITFNSLVDDGYQTPATITGTFGGGVETKSATYQTDIYTVYVTSNQSPDATIAAKKVSVSYTGLTTAKEVGNNGTVKVPAGLTPTATATDETGYAKTVTVLTASRLITAAYETTIISINMVGENGGMEGAAPQGAQATVSYQGGADQVLTDNTQTAKVPTGTVFTITYAAVSGYATPATYSATATGASMTATKATYVYGALQLTVSMSDSDATALASVAPMIAVNSGTPTAMTGSGGVFTANLEVGDTYEITFNSLVDDGYQTPAAITGSFGGGVETKSATYQTTIYTVSVTSNQQSDTPITSKKVSVDYTGLSTPKEVGNGGTVKVPSNLTPTATADDVTNYAKSVSVDSSLHTITAAYQTTVVSVNMVGENGGVEGAAPQGAQATVSYQGGTDQVLTSNAQTAKVPTGTAFTITYATVSGYATPAAYSATAAGTSMTATKATYVYGVLQLTVSMSDSDATDLAKVAPMISINSGTAVAMTGSGGVFTANLETNDTYEITFNSLVADGYQTPSAISGTFLGGVQTETAQYLTTILTLTSIVTTKDGNVQGANPQGAGVVVTYTGQTTPATLTAINDSVKVPSNLTPTITAETVYGYAATASESSGSITLTYATISYTLNVGTNQASNTDIANTVIRVSATGISANGYIDYTGAQSSVEILVPAGVNPTAACQSGAPSANEYAESITVDTTNHTIAAVYSTEVLTISITKDAGDGDLSTCSVAVTNGGTTLGTLTNASPTLKIAYGINYTCTPSAIAGYTAPAAVTKNWADTTAKSLTFEYEEQAGFVDLGLPSGKKWAVGNLVKDSQGNYSIGDETDWGTYISWGNIDGHNEGEGYDFSSTNYNSTPGASVAANIPSNDAQHDICLAKLGTPWHLPTKEDYQELYDNTDSEWVADYNGTGVAGRKFMKKTDHSVYVFFPASGICSGTSLNGRGSGGFYWSSSWSSSSSAYYLYFDSSTVSPQNFDDRRFGFTVRPVQ